jgi:hypothetical protein
MKPKIEKTRFGSITVGGETYDHDLIIRLNGKVEKRKKKLSKAVFGTSHIISLDEARYVHEAQAERLIIGSGQNDMVKLSPEAQTFLNEKGCQVELLPTPLAAERWNQIKGKTIALFHITC